MIGLRGAEILFEYPSTRHPLRSQPSKTALYLRKYSPISDKLARHDELPSELGVDARVQSTVAMASVTPTDTPLKVKKLRKQRGSKDGSHDSTTSQASVRDGQQHESKITQVISKARRRGPSLTRFNLRRKLSAQEMIASVKEAYHSRPSLNLSRVKLREPNFAEDIGAENVFPGKATHNTKIRQSSPTSLSACSTANGNFSRKLPTRRKPRHKRQSNSLDATPPIQLTDSPVSRLDDVADPEL